LQAGLPNPLHKSYCLQYGYSGKGYGNKYGPDYDGGKGYDKYSEEYGEDYCFSSKDEYVKFPKFDKEVGVQ
jgi:hypothetical protein